MFFLLVTWGLLVVLDGACVGVTTAALFWFSFHKQDPSDDWIIIDEAASQVMCGLFILQALGGSPSMCSRRSLCSLFGSSGSRHLLLVAPVLHLWVWALEVRE